MSLPTNLPDLPTFSLHVTVHIRPTDVEAFFRTMQPCFEAVTAEPECVYFEIYQDPEDSGKISWVENWNATPEWLMTVSVKVNRPGWSNNRVLMGLAGAIAARVLSAVL